MNKNTREIISTTSALVQIIAPFGLYLLAEQLNQIGRARLTNIDRINFIANEIVVRPILTYTIVMLNASRPEAAIPVFMATSLTSFLLLLRVRQNRRQRYL